MRRANDFRLSLLNYQWILNVCIHVVVFGKYKGHDGEHHSVSPIVIHAACPT